MGRVRARSSRRRAREVATKPALVVNSVVYVSLTLLWGRRLISRMVKSFSAPTATVSPARPGTPTPADPRPYDSGVAAQRCPTCLTNWPLGKDYVECPEDGDRTRFMRDEQPIPNAEAAARASQARVKRYAAGELADENSALPPLTLAEANRFLTELSEWDGTLPS